MPRSRVFEFLVLVSDGEPATKEDWYAVIEARKAHMLEHIRELGQEELGNVALRHSGYYDHSVRLCFGKLGDGYPGSSPLIADPGLSLSTRGVFIFHDCGTVKSGSGLIWMAVYGFTRSGGDWIIANIQFRAGRSGIYDKKIEVRYTNLPSLMADLRIDAADILAGFSKIIEQHAERRRKLAAEADEMWNLVQTEDCFLERRWPHL